MRGKCEVPTDKYRLSDGLAASLFMEIQLELGRDTKLLPKSVTIYQLSRGYMPENVAVRGLTTSIGLQYSD
jgi:hypothetical protein